MLLKIFHRDNLEIKICHNLCALSTELEIPAASVVVVGVTLVLVGFVVELFVNVVVGVVVINLVVVVGRLVVVVGLEVSTVVLMSLDVFLTNKSKKWFSI